MAHGVVEPEGGTPIVDDEGDVLQPHLLNEGFHIPCVVKEAVLKVRLVGLAHADEIESDRPAVRRQIRNDVPPQVGGCRIAMKKEDWITRPLIDIVHFGTVNLQIVGLEWKLC